MRPDENELAHQVVCKAKIYSRDAITVTHVGTSEFLRGQLAAFYLLHLQTVVQDYITFCDALNVPLLKKQVDRINEPMLDRLFGCHVALAKDLLLRQEDLTDILPHDQRRERAQHMLQFTLDTITQFARQAESLWVRGPIDLLDGTTVRPWIKTKKEA